MFFTVSYDPPDYIYIYTRLEPRTTQQINVINEMILFFIIK